MRPSEPGFGDTHRLGFSFSLEQVPQLLFAGKSLMREGGTVWKVCRNLSFACLALAAPCFCNGEAKPPASAWNHIFFPQERAHFALGDGGGWIYNGFGLWLGRMGWLRRSRFFHSRGACIGGGYLTRTIFIDEQMRQINGAIRR